MKTTKVSLLVIACKTELECVLCQTVGRITDIHEQMFKDVVANILAG